MSQKTAVPLHFLLCDFRQKTALRVFLPSSHVVGIRGNRFKLVLLTDPLRTDTQTDRRTSNEHIISAIHSVHLADIIIAKIHVIYKNKYKN